VQPRALASVARVRRSSRGTAQVIGFAKQVAHTSPQPVAPPAPIHPLDARYPVEIITPLAAGMGQLQVELYELYGQHAWDRLKGIAGSVDIVDIFHRVANSPNPITMVKVIKPPRFAASR
jgi:hypothetical protein